MMMRRLGSPLARWYASAILIAVSADSEPELVKNTRCMPAGATCATAVAASNAAAPQARARPGHNTPLLVLYGSNLGTAEELATRVADLAEVNGFATKLGALDDHTASNSP